MFGKLNSALETERWAELIILSWEKKNQNKTRFQHQYDIISKISSDINEYNLLKCTATLSFLQPGCFRNSKMVRTPRSHTGTTQDLK